MSHDKNDSFDREIEQLMAVDPSPGFAARVRGRIAGAGAPWYRRHQTLLVVAACAVVVVGAVAWSGFRAGERIPSTAGTTASARVPVPAPAPLPEPVAASVSVVLREPEAVAAPLSGALAEISPREPPLNDDVRERLGAFALEETRVPALEVAPVQAIVLDPLPGLDLQPMLEIKRLSIEPMTVAAQRNGVQE